MGEIYTDVMIKGKKDKLLSNILVDTGATESYLPKGILEEIEATRYPQGDGEVELGDGRKIWTECYLARIKIEDREGANFIFTFEEVKPAIGVITLERLGFKVNPITGRLEPTRPKGIMFR